MQVTQETTKNTWKSQAGYIWAVLGSAVGFANILSFSAQCYKNGGGAFLIPSVFAYLLLGIPLLMLEGFIGQKYQRAFVGAYGLSIGRIGKVIGWMSIIACMTIGGFYVVLTGYALAYTYFSATGQISVDTAHFFKHEFLQVSSSLTDLGSLPIAVVVATAVVITITTIVLLRGIQDGIEKVCSFGMPLLAVLVFVFAGITIFLPGAHEGIRQYLTPDFSRLKDFNLWRDVFGQLFFSLSLGLGIITGYSRYNGENINIVRAMGWVALGDFIISSVAGLVIFSCIGYMSHNMQQPFHEIVKSDSIFEIGFVVFPTLIHIVGGWLGRILGTIFFLCVFIAGITGVFSIIESIAGNIEEEFHIERSKAVKRALSIVIPLSIIFCMGNGLHILGALEPMVLGIVMLVAGLSEAIAYLFINSEFRQAFYTKLSIIPGPLLNVLRFIIVAILATILIGALHTELTQTELTLSTFLRWLWLGVILFAAFYLGTKRKALPS
ncbi:MAG: sodium-dependent transporter [Chlamydiales bacterium]|nr:sodium-dependent transporter [Chlamydiales bacterium]